ncbi:protein of unknown function [Xenorhabdus nematophila AN6/1]|nr:protein of unknown function [Xenorhabdus nematophila AN6/1]
MKYQDGRESKINCFSFSTNGGGRMTCHFVPRPACIVISLRSIRALVEGSRPSPRGYRFVHCFVK